MWLDKNDTPGDPIQILRRPAYWKNKGIDSFFLERNISKSKPLKHVRFVCIHQPCGHSDPNMRHVAKSQQSSIPNLACVCVFEHWCDAKPLLINYHTENQINMKWKSAIDRVLCISERDSSKNRSRTHSIETHIHIEGNVQFLWMTKNRADFWSSKLMLILSNLPEQQPQSSSLYAQQNSREKTRSLC